MGQAVFVGIRAVQMALVLGKNCNNIFVSDYITYKYIDFGLFLDGLEWSEIRFKMGKMGKKMLRCND